MSAASSLFLSTKDTKRHEVMFALTLALSQGERGLWRGRFARLHTLVSPEGEGLLESSQDGKKARSYVYGNYGRKTGWVHACNPLEDVTWARM